MDRSGGRTNLDKTENGTGGYDSDGDDYGEDIGGLIHDGGNDRCMTMMGKNSDCQTILKMGAKHRALKIDIGQE